MNVRMHVYIHTVCIVCVYAHMYTFVCEHVCVSVEVNECVYVNMHTLSMCVNKSMSVATYV